MPNRRSPLALMVVVAGCLAPVAVAEEPCECNCYFSSDCVNGSCYYGESFTIQDSCWWRQPKPQGLPGAGCTGDFDDWGQCDGRCTDTIHAGERWFGRETPDTVREGVRRWASVLEDVSMSGGGAPSIESARGIDAIGFNDATVGYTIWRLVTEALMIARGSDYLVFPPQDAGMIWDIAVGDVSGDPVAQRNGRLAVAALLAEMDEAGQGREIILSGVDARALDPELFDRLCPSGDWLDCLHQRLATLGTALRQAGVGGTGQAGITPPCPGCVGDIDNSDDVNFADLLMLLDAWGDSNSPADVNGDGVVDFADLLDMLAGWGTCVPG